MPEPEEDEFYLADLIGLTACDVAGNSFGTVTAVHDYGAGRESGDRRDGATPLLVPFTRAAVPEVDVARGRVIVAPPEELDARPEDGNPGADQSVLAALVPTTRAASDDRDNPGPDGSP